LVKGGKLSEKVCPRGMRIGFGRSLLVVVPATFGKYQRSESSLRPTYLAILTEMS